MSQQNQKKPEPKITVLTRKEHLTLCPDCEGKGHGTVRSVRDSMSWMPDRVIIEDCPTCENTGRIIVIHISTQQPYRIPSEEDLK